MNEILNFRFIFILQQLVFYRTNLCQNMFIYICNYIIMKFDCHNFWHLFSMKKMFNYIFRNFFSGGLVSCLAFNLIYFFFLFPLLVTRWFGWVDINPYYWKCWTIQAVQTCSCTFHCIQKTRHWSFTGPHPFAWRYGTRIGNQNHWTWRLMSLWHIWKPI